MKSKEIKIKTYGIYTDDEGSGRMHGKNYITSATVILEATSQKDAIKRAREMKKLDPRWYGYWAIDITSHCKEVGKILANIRRFPFGPHHRRRKA